jgi:hypothetical protein
MRVLSTVFVALLIAACGGSKPPPSNSAAPAPAASGSAAPAPAASADKPTIESQREPFIQSCMTKVKSPDYCACGFDQFREVFKDADMSQDVPANDPRLAALQQKTIAACAGKLPEDQIKATFVTTCVGDDKRKAAYCDCAWPALRKNLAPSDFVGDMEGARFLEAKKAMVATCKGKFPNDIAKSDFMTACTKGDATRGKSCECLWKKIRAKFSAEEVVAGTADVASIPGLKECK